MSKIFPEFEFKVIVFFFFLLSIMTNFTLPCTHCIKQLFFLCLIHPFVLAGCLVWAFEEGYISLNDFSISYDKNLFSLNTVINILALFGLLAYRIELGKLLFNLGSTINNFLLFIPLFCLVFFVYCAFTIPTLFITVISASWGYEEPHDNILKEWDWMVGRFMSQVREFNGIREAIE